MLIEYDTSKNPLKYIQHLRKELFKHEQVFNQKILLELAKQRYDNEKNAFDACGNLNYHHPYYSTIPIDYVFDDVYYVCLTWNTNKTDVENFLKSGLKKHLVGVITTSDDWREQVKDLKKKFPQAVFKDIADFWTKDMFDKEEELCR